MKTLIFTMGLLLLFTVYCVGTPRGVSEMAPGFCCFKFFTGKIPKLEIISISKTHNGCLRKGFVVSTAIGKDMCVSQNRPWAQEAFNRQHVNKM